ncbi:hemolysin-3, putative [Entamoeba dispar SAW760]|uniref:Hemolysin-3, putative n=1 Tax=Entamoeba dispar (strain ATCC PRA-260 / SAW760) TaxID=370354 RepID=B0EAH9_ENTDS|nr:hemolysin-3, putative [Entamoeba dispar SAW760]EDR28492.1 hemolysin-3, putative [Entamoeba dispar SAW760]|eukprot:EDR28492.1 hemolysin-3, putative [Entamoeba dispar SAW760]
MCFLCDIQTARNQLTPLDERPQCLLEEVVNVLTHLFGIFYAIFIFKMFRRYAQKHNLNKMNNVAILCFCLASFTLYFNSTTYHLLNILLPNSICLRYFFQRLDHITIYIMISGCYLCFIFTRTFAKGYFKTGCLAIFIVIALALTGFIFTIFAPPTTRTDVIMYLAMGWSCVLYGPLVFYFCPLSLVFYLFTGGISYAIGTVFVAWDQLFFNHGIWHLIVWFANFQHSLGVLIAIDDEDIKGFKQPWSVMKELFVEYISVSVKNNDSNNHPSIQREE